MYFEKNYSEIRFSEPKEGKQGLHNAQIGAIHSIASHFTISDEPAIVTMPTGSGKTAVLMMTPFILKAKRVLVITPSKMVREQIREDFESLETLKKINVVKTDLINPKVIEVKNKINSIEKWEALKEFDVVISTPNCISPFISDIPNPPDDLFDLLLIDEAHHSPAKTWHEILKSFSSTKKVLFTATPFRHDRREIKGKFIYSYPLVKAYQDKIFGKIIYVPVNEENLKINNDIALAKKAEEILREDISNGFNHRLMIRTDTKKRAEDLIGTYKENTGLRLELVNSDYSQSKIKNTLDKLKSAELDGIICVNMLGEGFNFPNLKIAVIHTPHKSLEITLQFIGRFARTNAHDVGDAKFLAVPGEIEIEGEKIFDDGAVWQEIITNLSHMRINQETRIREVLQEFKDPIAGDIKIKDISLYSLHPRQHVKIYQSKNEIDISQDIELKFPFEICYRNNNIEDGISLLITREIGKPKWIASDQFADVKYDLFVIYFHKASKLLFINSSRTIDGLYQEISHSLDPKCHTLATSEIKKVLSGIINTNFFNIGMRNSAQTNNTESYRILAGAGTQGAVKQSDARLYRQGHAFCTGEENGKRITIGFSSGSKVWSSSPLKIPELVRWCADLAEKIKSKSNVVTNSAFDDIPSGLVISTLPENIIFGDWDKTAYDFNNPIKAKFLSKKGEEVICHITDLDLIIDHEKTDSDNIFFNIVAEDNLNYPVSFNLEDFFQSTGATQITLEIGETEMQLVDYLNEHYIVFHTAEGSMLIGNEFYEYPTDGIIFDRKQIEAIDWQGVDIKNECNAATAAGESIQDFLSRRLLGEDNKIVIFDHGSGEVADFIVVKETEEKTVFQFYHCKKSGGTKAGSRLQDIYEVCGQAEKSIAWARSSRLYKKIKTRHKDNSKFHKGNMEDFKRAMENIKIKGCIFEIFIVQPGISSSQLTDAIALNLGATNDHLVNAGCEKLKIIAST